MASENVKIVIKEVNETSPKGSGASSDIVYIPGLANDIIGYEGEKTPILSQRNKPILCTSIAEFEYNFGDTPYKLTDADAAAESNYNNYITGGYDLSYVYAKELLRAGISVYYENICKNDAELNAEIAALNEEIADRKDLENNIYSAEQSVEAAQERLDDALEGTDIEEQDEAREALEEAQNRVKAMQDELALIRPEAELTEEKNQLNAQLNMNKIDYLYSVLSDRLAVLEDKDEYSVKYITSGGYPTFYDIETPSNNTLAQTMINVACTRGDAVALVDHVRNDTLPLDPFNRKSVYYAVNKFSWSNGSFGAMFTPYGKYACMTINDDTSTKDANEALQIMPASFGYLMCVASAIKTSPNWLAMAGVTRGIVPNLQELTPNQLLSNIIAEDYQPKYGGNASNKLSINSITNIRPYGLTLWGNRTLEQVPEKGTTALNFLNTRNMVSDIKKLAHTTAKSLMFEQDSDALWLKFKSKITPTLEQLKTGFGISDYKILKATTKIDGSALTRGELAAVIRIYPLYAVEYFDITIAISDNES